MKVREFDLQSLKTLSEAVKTSQQLKAVLNAGQLNQISQAMASVQKMLPENMAELNALFNQINKAIKNAEKPEPKPKAANQTGASKKAAVRSVDINTVINLLLLLISLFGLVIELNAQTKESSTM